METQSIEIDKGLIELCHSKKERWHTLKGFIMDMVLLGMQTKYKADSIKFVFIFDMWGRSEALQFWSTKYDIKGENISKYFYSIDSVTTLS